MPKTKKDKPKFKIGDTVVYVGDISGTGSCRNVGDTFVVTSIDKYTKGHGNVYFEHRLSSGEYAMDIRLASKLHKAMK